jgi:signal transduction histidine kinase
MTIAPGTTTAVDAGPDVRRIERLVLLGAAGVALAAIQRFAPLLWPYGLGSSWSTLNQAWLFAIDLLWVAAMLVVYARDPAGPMWRLFLLLLAVDAASAVWVVPTSLTWTLSQLLVGLGSVVFVHVVLAFPSGRLSDPVDRRFVAGAYGFLAVTRLLWLLVWQPTPVDVIGFLPRNPFVLRPDETLAWLVGPVATVGLSVALAVGVIVGLWRHWHRAGPALRRALLPVAIAAPVQLAVTVVWTFAGANPAEWGDVRSALQSPAFGMAGLIFPVGLLVGLVRARLARAQIVDLAVELGRGVPLGGLRDALARALRDPSLVVAFPAPAGEGFVDSDGQAVAVPAGSPDRGVARLERDGETFAVLVYDPAVEREDPGRVAAVGSMATMALENERLAAQVRAQLEEVRASRLRIVEAADAERRRIERDLHDGAQQRLVALAIRLDQARGGSAASSELIDSTTTELLTAIGEVRDLARGLHPTILTEAGLGAAVEALAERAPLPVTVDVPDTRFPPEVEGAAYFVVAEGLTNVARYAGATAARVEVRVAGGVLTVTVADDGQGGADPAAGSGLRGLEDRLAAVGGELAVRSDPGGGTTLVGRLPISPRSA